VKREIRKVNKKEVPASHFVRYLPFQGEEVKRYKERLYEFDRKAFLL
jgi:hypothetical protein